MISIQHIILYGCHDYTLDLTGVSTCLVLDKPGGDLVVIVTGNVCMRGTINGVLTLLGDGNVTLCGVLMRNQLILDEFTGTFDENGFYQDLIGGSVFWVFATNTNLVNLKEITAGGIR